MWRSYVVAGQIKLPEVNVGDLQITFPARGQSSSEWTEGRPAGCTVRSVRPTSALSNIQWPRYGSLKSRSPVIKITVSGDFVKLLRGILLKKRQLLKRENEEETGKLERKVNIEESAPLGAQWPLVFANPN
ncbi:hypothetical protein HAX54_024840 [Datura stramonium]|uniref:Uncharacterized protein n=1 Tax=Datura stramonium TaxID=4076 RepID=A0ABS8V047_DATST|nr:hypothetical protein [Datura stramonium]